jgi:pimeloyl-ACP methyl ester carboxylesterase
MTLSLLLLPLLLATAPGSTAPRPSPATEVWRAGRLNLAGATLAYSERGRGETVVFVHGRLEDGRAWLPVAGPLAASYHVVTYSRRGHEPGRIAGPGPAGTPEADAEDLVTLLQAVDGEPVHVVGYGDGAVVGLLAARLKPHLVRSLVLVEPGLDEFVTDASARRAAARSRAEVAAAEKKALAAGDTLAALQAAVTGISGAPETFGRLSEESRRILADHAGLLGTPRSRPPACGDLWRVRAPVLIVADAAPDPEAAEYRDTPAPPAAAGGPGPALAADALARCLRASDRVALDPSGPMPHHLQPAALARAIREFVEQNARARLAVE